MYMLLTIILSGLVGLALAWSAPVTVAAGFLGVFIWGLCQSHRETKRLLNEFR